MIYFVGAVFILCAGVGFYYVFPAFWLKYFATRLLKKKADKKNALFLTFDDGPGDALTLQLLDLLKTFSGTATFFVTGERAEACPEILRSIHKEQVVASHGYEHLHHLKVAPWRAVSDIKKGWSAIDRVLGESRGVYPFRPTYGRLNGISLVYLWLKKAPVIYWTLDSGDARKHLPDDDIFKKIVADPCQVILMHDYDRPVDYAFCKRFTLTLTERILNHAQAADIRTNINLF